jgi:hypothetical protein
MDKRSGFIWHQKVIPGYHVASDGLSLSANSISGTVVGKGESYLVKFSLSSDSSQSLDLSVGIPNKRYTTLPDYPFLFSVPAKDWYYVQNTSGEGLLMPLEKWTEIYKMFGWNGSQPWWGLTDLKQSLTVRLDSFRKPDARVNAEDQTVYGVPLRISYSFSDKGGYVELAKEYRAFYLRQHPDLQPLSARLRQRPALSNLKDGVYVYLWGRNPAEDLSLVQEMRAAGVDHGVAMFYGKHEVTRELFDGIKQSGWTVGLYHMPTGNLTRVSRNRGWPEAILLGRVSPAALYAESDRRAWDRICAKHILPEWIAKAKELINNYGVQVFYFDTLVAQLAPCLDPAHPSTIEENEEARLEIMRKTQDLGMVVGSGEGLCPTWALPGLDFFEGLMSLRPYADNRLKIPAGGYETDLGESYAPQAAITLDETRRIPLYQLAFHDYVVGTWVWRDTNFQSRPYARKKDLFNILYGTMPMWHMTQRLWDEHKADYVESYKNISAVRARIGFAEMLNHGWLTADRKVQFTDWSTGDRVIVNFGDQPYARDGKPAVGADSFAIEKTR